MDVIEYERLSNLDTNSSKSTTLFIALEKLNMGIHIVWVFQ